MDRRLVAVVIGIAAVIVGAIVAVLVLTPPATPDAAPTTSVPATTPDTDSVDPAETDAAEPKTAGTYVEYSDEAIANADGRVLLFFHAPWCPQCRSVENDIVASGVPAGVTIVKVDFDSRQDLRQRYGVTLQTTFVEVDADGEELQKHVAYDDPHLDAVVAAML